MKVVLIILGILFALMAVTFIMCYRLWKKCDREEDEAERLYAARELAADEKRVELTDKQYKQLMKEGATVHKELGPIYMSKEHFDARG